MYLLPESSILHKPCFEPRILIGHLKIALNLVKRVDVTPLCYNVVNSELASNSFIKYLQCQEFFYEPNTYFIH